jgi:hypothetical protein
VSGAFPDVERAPRAGWTPLRACALLVLLLTGATSWGLFWWTSRTQTGSIVLPGALAAATALGSAVVWPGALLDRTRRAAVERRRRAHPAAPWLWDHAWDPSGVSRTARSRILRASTFPALWLVPWFANVGRPGGRPAAFAVLGVLLSWWAWRIFRVLGGGSSHVAFASFPFAPGGRATLRFGTSADGATFETVSFGLRRVVEVEGRLIAKEHVVVASEPIPPTPPVAALPGPEQYVEVSFDVPADAAPTRLSDAFPSYWVMDVVGTTSAGPFAETFLVPIYERPAA